MARKKIGKTKSAYKIRLDDLTCDRYGCEMLSEFCIVYSTDSGDFFHQFWCTEHEATLPQDSVVFEEAMDPNV